MTTQKEDKKVTTTNKQKYPYWDEIRASWVANQKHCNPTSPSRRKTFIEKGISFSDKWVGEMGFLRYYLFHVDHGYIPGNSKLLRKDEDKGFNAQNCIIVHNAKTDNDLELPVEPTVKEPVSPMNVTNNFIIIDNADAAKQFINSIVGR